MAVIIKFRIPKIPPEPDSPGIDKFPRTHYNLRELPNWPDQTMLACWHCTRHFSGKPIGLPYQFDGNVYYTKGCFCTFQCANTYNRYSLDPMKFDQESMLYSLFRLNGGAGEIPIAPPKEILLKYGGPATDAEYQSILNRLNVHVSLAYPPMVAVQAIASVIEIDEAKTISTQLRAAEAAFLPSHSIRSKGMGPGFRISRKTPLYSNSLNIPGI